MTRSLLLKEKTSRMRATSDTAEYVRLMFEDVYGAKFVEGEHHRKLARILDDFVAQVEAGENPNLMVFLPPRSGKTTLLTSMMAKFVGVHPNWEIILSSYNEDRGADMGRMVKRHLNNPRFQELFPDCQLSKDSTSAVRSEFTKGGAMTATGVGTATTGRGSRIFLVDDPVKDYTDADSPLKRDEVWQWYGSVVSTRLAPEGAGQILALTRWHADDLAGRILEAARKDPEAPQFQVYSFPAISGDESKPETEKSFFPERFKLGWLRKKRSALRSVNPRMWSALYQQNPIPEEGAIFKAAWFKNSVVSESMFPDITQTTNCVTADFAVSAGKGDFTSIYPVSFDSKDVCWVRPGHFRAQADPKESMDALCYILTWLQPMYFFVEKGPIWRTLCSTITRDIFRKARCYPQVIEISRGKNNKATVAGPYIGAVQNNQVRYADNPHFHEILLPQHLSFGVGSVDDDVDALALPFVERSTLILPTDEVPLPDVETSFEQQRDAWIKKRCETPDGEDESADPFPLFAGDRRG
jgi:hypothetical protein